MEWEKVRKKYPKKWVAFESLKQHECEGKLFIDQLFVIQEFDDINEAFKYYKQEKHKNKNKINLANTRDKELSYRMKYILSNFK